MHMLYQPNARQHAHHVPVPVLEQRIRRRQAEHRAKFSCCALRQCRCLSGWRPSTILGTMSGPDKAPTTPTKALRSTSGCTKSASRILQLACMALRFYRCLPADSETSLCYPSSDKACLPCCCSQRHHHMLRSRGPQRRQHNRLLPGWHLACAAWESAGLGVRTVQAPNSPISCPPGCH